MFQLLKSFADGLLLKGSAPTVVLVPDEDPPLKRFTVIMPHLTGEETPSEIEELAKEALTEKLASSGEVLDVEKALRDILFEMKEYQDALEREAFSSASPVTSAPVVPDDPEVVVQAERARLVKSRKRRTQAQDW